jgi:hypothetical protein
MDEVHDASCQAAGGTFHSKEQLRQADGSAVVKKIFWQYKQ